MSNSSLQCPSHIYLYYVYFCNSQINATFLFRVNVGVQLESTSEKLFVSSLVGLAELLAAHVGLTRRPVFSVMLVLFQLL